MMGKSYQKGFVTLRGKKWYGYFRKRVLDPTTQQEKTLRIPVILGLKSEMSRRAAEEALGREITKQNHQAGNGGVMNDSSVGFGWFVRNRYFPLKESDWSEETAKVKKLLIERDLIEPFDKVPLENFDKFTLQIHLKSLAKTRSKDRVLQMRAYLRDIFVEAVDQEFLVKDPARKLKVPAHLRETDKTTLTWEQLRKPLAELSLRDRLLLELDMTEALRPGELFALRWQCFNATENTVSLRETVYKGKIRSWGKTEGSLTDVHVPKKLSADLERWKQTCPNAAPDAFIFANEKGGFLDPSNYRRRVLHKLAEKLKLPKLTFQVIRRSIATLAQKKGTVKDVQGVLRHARAATTTDTYMQFIPASVQAVVDSIHSELRRPAKKSASARHRGKKLVSGEMGLTPIDTKRETEVAASC
jgi:integrase